MFTILPTLESNWTLILLELSTKKSSIIVRVIYRHSSMDLTDFNCNDLNKLLENISKEQNLFFYLETLLLPLEL